MMNKFWGFNVPHVVIVNNIVYLNLLGDQIVSILTRKKNSGERGVTIEAMDILTSLIDMIISQCIHISDHHFAHFKYTIVPQYPQRNWFQDLPVIPKPGYARVPQWASIFKDAELCARPCIYWKKSTYKWTCVQFKPLLFKSQPYFYFSAIPP